MVWLLCLLIGVCGGLFAVAWLASLLNMAWLLVLFLVFWMFVVGIVNSVVLVYLFCWVFSCLICLDFVCLCLWLVVCCV